MISSFFLILLYLILIYFPGTYGYGIRYPIHTV